MTHHPPHHPTPPGSPALPQPQQLRQGAGVGLPQLLPGRAMPAVAAYQPADHVPPTPPMPTMTISPKGVLYLTKGLMGELNLRNGDTLNLVPPVFGSVYWHLDLRPGGRHAIDWSGSVSIRQRGQSPRVKGIPLPPGLVEQNITLHLMPGKPTYEGYYPLLPSNAFAT